MDTAKALADLLVAAGVAPYWPSPPPDPIAPPYVFLYKEPTAPDEVITFYNTGGMPSDPKFALDYPSVQARIRGPRAQSATAGRALAQRVKDVLLGIASYTDGDGNRIVSVVLGSDITDMGFDENNRSLHTVNFRLIVEPVATGNRIAL